MRCYRTFYFYFYLFIYFLNIYVSLPSLQLLSLSFPLLIFYFLYVSFSLSSLHPAKFPRPCDYLSPPSLTPVPFPPHVSLSSLPDFLPLSVCLLLTSLTASNAFTFTAVPDIVLWDLAQSAED